MQDLTPCRAARTSGPAVTHMSVVVADPLGIGRTARLVSQDLVPRDPDLVGSRDHDAGTREGRRPVWGSLARLVVVPDAVASQPPVSGRVWGSGLDDEHAQAVVPEADVGDP